MERISAFKLDLIKKIGFISFPKLNEEKVVE